MTLNEGNGWSHTWRELDEKSDGEVIEYTVKEVGEDGGKITISNGAEYGVAYGGSAESGYTVTNSYTPETIKISGSKTWDDADNQDGKRPESITIRLYANGEEAVGHVQTVTAADSWSWKFTDLPKFEDGEEIIYTISEDQVSGYQPEIDGYDITNSYTPGKVSVTVSKSWEDENDQDGIRPDTVKIRLFADGKDTGKTLVLSEENRWSGIFADLDEYKNGEKINYSIKEDAVNGYHTVISGDAEKGFVVTNSHTPVKTESTPETGDRGTPALWIVLMGLAGTAIVTGSYLAEKKRKTYRK